MPTLVLNRMVIAQIVALCLATLAWFHIILPPSADATSITAAIMLVAAVVTAVLRYWHPGDSFAAAKPLLASKTIWTQIVSAGFAVVALTGVVPSIDQASVVEGIMTVLAFVSMIFGGSAKRAVA